MCNSSEKHLLHLYKVWNATTEKRKSVMVDYIIYICTFCLHPLHLKRKRIKEKISLTFIQKLRSNSNHWNAVSCKSK